MKTEFLFKDTTFDMNLAPNPFENISEMLITKQVMTANKNYEENNKTPRSQGMVFDLVDKTARILRMVPLARHWVGPPDETSAQISKLIAQQKAALSYKEWLATSNRLDKLMLNFKWKEEKESNLYDYKLLEERYTELRDARLNGDYRELLYIIRTKWCRNMANIDNINLYRHSFVGTKNLIEDYLDECSEVLNIFSKGETNLEESYVLGMLTQTRKNIGRTALVLSGGGCFGLFHIGVLATLLELELFPKIISGSSAGGIMASIICVQTNEELLELMATITERNFEIFNSDDDQKDGFLKCLARLLKYGTWFDNANLQKTMKEFLGDLTFRESYNRTGRILNITVSSASVHEQPSLLNYLTAPNVLIWSAVCASCSLPGVFPSSTIYEKNTKDGSINEWSNPMVKFVDGSVHGDLPITRLSEMFNVDHIIACQVNPHVVPFLKMSIQCVGGEIENEFSAKVKQICNQLYGLVSTEAMHYLEVLSEVGIATNICTKLRSIIAQQYSGDITILPDIRLSELGKILTNPQPDFILDATVRGARATWPKISLIRNHCRLEFLLDQCITKIRSRLLSAKANSLFNPQLSLIANDSSGEDEIDINYGSSKNGNIKISHIRRRSETLSVGNMDYQLHTAGQIHTPKRYPKPPARLVSTGSFKEQKTDDNPPPGFKKTLYDLKNQSLGISQSPSPKQIRTQSLQYKAPAPGIGGHRRPGSHNSSSTSIRSINANYFQTNSPVPKILSRRKSVEILRRKRSATYTGSNATGPISGSNVGIPSSSTLLSLKRKPKGAATDKKSVANVPSAIGGNIGSSTGSLRNMNQFDDHGYAFGYDNDGDDDDDDEDDDNVYDFDTRNNTITNASRRQFDDSTHTEDTGIYGDGDDDQEATTDNGYLEGDEDDEPLTMGFSYYLNDTGSNNNERQEEVDEVGETYITSSALATGTTDEFTSNEDDVAHEDEYPKNIDNIDNNNTITNGNNRVDRSAGDSPRDSKTSNRLRKTISFENTVKSAKY